jgi:CRP-like cAMP-binding protein
MQFDSRPTLSTQADPASVPLDPLVRRLEDYSALSAEAREALARLSARPPVRIAARRDLIRQGAAPECLYLISQGWACRYKTLPDGRRQIVDFLIPGDLCELNIYILSRIDHSIGAITALDVIEIPREALEAVTDTYPQITRALWWQELVSKSCHREWIVNVGARSALERIAHLLCEIFVRLESVGATDGHSCDFPLTQNDLGDATGLTAVHVNRTLQRLREQGLITLADRKLVIHDITALKALGLFNPDYLHLERLQGHKGRKAEPSGTSVRSGGQSQLRS